MGKKIQILLLSFFVLAFPVNFKSQKKINSNPLETKGDVAFKDGLYDKSLMVYKKAYSKSRGIVEKGILSYKIAETYNKQVDFEQAIVWYQKAIQLKYKDPIAIKKLAKLNMSMSKYDDAISQFKKYKVEVVDDPETNQLIKACKEAINWLENPRQLEVLEMTLLNTPNAEVAPTYLSEKIGKVELYFTSNREGSLGSKSSLVTGANFADIYTSNRDKKGKWSEPVIVDIINSEFSEGGLSFDRKRKTIYFTRCSVKKEGIQGCSIYYSLRQGVKWGEPTKLDLGTDSNSYGHPALSANNMVMIFASDMEGSVGGKDLWYITYDKKARAWSKNPVNLGKEINTTGDELYPFISSEGSLYFSSNGHVGMGGWDLYKSKAIGVNQWGKPENLRYPYNSPKNDVSIVYQSDMSKGFISSDRNGNFDIFEVFKPPILFTLEGVVKDMETGSPISGAIVKLVGTDGTEARVSSDDKGNFIFSEKGAIERYINQETSYSLLVSKTGYLNAKGKESTTSLKESRRFFHEYSLQPYKNKVIKLPEIRYEFGKANLLLEAKDSLNYLYEVMVDNPNIVIQLRSHTDHIGTDENNLKLSNARSQSCTDYLVKEKGIDPNRIVALGMGETDPIVTVTGIKLTEEYIENLATTAEKDAARQRNRRTDFKVIRDDFKPQPK